MRDLSVAEVVLYAVQLKLGVSGWNGKVQEGVVDTVLTSVQLTNMRNVRTKHLTKGLFLLVSYVYHDVH